jgi:hypothetical protein
MDEKKEQLRKGIDNLEQVEIQELSENDLDSVAGGNVSIEDSIAPGGVTCNSSWCCSNT